MAQCPPRESLEDLLAETLSDAERAQVEAHVEQCRECQNTLHNLTIGAGESTSSGLLSANATLAGKRPSADSEDFFRRLKRMKPPTVVADDADALHALAQTDAERIDSVQLEGYEILGELGRGAAGVVYRARHLKLNRLVALKVIVAGQHLSSESRQRFWAEAHAIARLQHPNIVQIYDVGEHDKCPFLSLELVEGGNLADWMAGKPRPANDSARIISTLAKAVEYAHRQGVVHRDLKPSNVLLAVVSSQPAKRELKITDFGIAKVLPGAGMTEAQMTQTGEILGTPTYMAPEQARGNASEICPATDVYSLGAILYELLTGRPPFQGATPLDTLMQAAHHDPVPISLLVARVPRDLNTICLKCLEKDPAKRYTTAGDLNADLSRFLKNEPILARPLSRAGQGLRWVRRHQGLAAALSGVAILLVLLTIVSLFATAHFRKLEQQQVTLTGEKEVERGKAVTAQQREAELREQAENVSRELRKNEYFDQMNLAAQAANSPSGIGRVSDWLAPWGKSPPDLRNWEWFYLNGLCHRDLLTLSGHLNGVLDVAWSRDGRRLASSGRDGHGRIWDAAHGREIRSLWQNDSDVTTVAWNPAGDRVAAAEIAGIVKIWNADTGEEVLKFLGHTGPVFAVAWSPDGKSLASGGDDQTVQIWDAGTGKVQQVFRGNRQSVRDVAWSPDGKRIASAGQDWDIRIWNTADGSDNVTLHGHINIVNRICWSPDGTKLASASNDQTIKIWNPSTGIATQTLRGHTLEVQSVAWSPDGARLASCGYDQTVKVWSAANGNELFALRGHTQGITSVKWSPDGQRLASSSFDATVKIWDATAGSEARSLTGHLANIWTVAWSADGARIASGGEDRTVRIWRAAQGNEQFTLRGHTDQVRAVAWNAAGTRLASAGLDGTIRIWDTSDGRQLRVIPGNLQISSLAWSPDGNRLASGGVDHVVHLWDANTGNEVLSCQGHQNAVWCVAWSPDGTRLASASGDQTVKIWDPTTGQPLISLAGSDGGFFSVIWSPDGQQIASACNDQTIRIWNALTGQLIQTLRGHTSAVLQVAWSPDGSRLASCSDDQTVKLWDVQSGKEAASLNDQSARIKSVAWSPDGVALATAGDGHTVRIYDAMAGYVSARAPQYLPVLDRRLSSEPKDLSARAIRADIEAHLGQWSKAAADFDQYIQIDPNRHWFQTGYWVAGPYPDDLQASYAPEKDPDPTHPLSLTGGAEPLPVPNWQTAPCNAAGYVNFGKLCGNADHVSAYAMLRVYSPRKQQMAILLGSDDQVRLWLNGKVIHEILTGRAAVIDQDAVPATLSAGWNTVLARVANIEGTHLLYMRLTNDPVDMKRARGQDSAATRAARTRAKSERADQ